MKELIGRSLVSWRAVRDIGSGFCEIGTLEVCDDNYDTGSAGRIAVEFDFRSFGLDLRSVFDRQCVISPSA